VAKILPDNSVPHLGDFAGAARELAERWFVRILRDDPPICLVEPGLWCKTPGDAEKLVRRIDEAIVTWYRTFRTAATIGDREAVAALIDVFDDFAARQRASIERCLVGIRWENTRIGLLGLLTYVGIDAERLQREHPQRANRPRPALREVP